MAPWSGRGNWALWQAGGGGAAGAPRQGMAGEALPGSRALHPPPPHLSLPPGHFSSTIDLRPFSPRRLPCMSLRPVLYT